MLVEYTWAGTYKHMSTPNEHESKQLKIRSLVRHSKPVQWYSQEEQDVGYGHKPREGNIWGNI